MNVSLVILNKKKLN